jgi:hypothetical protein
MTVFTFHHVTRYAADLSGANKRSIHVLKRKSMTSWSEHIACARYNRNHLSATLSSASTHTDQCRWVVISEGNPTAIVRPGKR